MVRTAHTMMWWSIWGLVVGIGLFGLQEAPHNRVHLLLSFPLLAGAFAAAASRLRHEYHEAMLHAKWVAISSGLLLLGTGYLYLRTQGYGPFASASAHKAFLGTTFEMSMPEVERALGRKLVAAGESSSPEGLRDWMLDMVPDFERKSESRILPDITLYHVPCRVKFDFAAGKLARVRAEFQPTVPAETLLLVQHILEDFSNEYKQAPTSPRSAMLFRKEAVDATVDRTPVDALHEQVSVVLQYLPLADQQPEPLAVDSHAF
jgi:hypothetical protein